MAITIQYVLIVVLLMLAIGQVVFTAAIVTKIKEIGLEINEVAKNKIIKHAT